MDEERSEISIDRVQEILDGLAEELPPIFYEELNGGILLLPEAHRSQFARADDLWTLGEYRHSHAMGRYIVIYYGSFMRLFGHASEEKLTEELRKTLKYTRNANLIFPARFSNESRQKTPLTQ
jgi:hypothetical protein